MATTSERPDITESKTLENGITINERIVHVDDFHGCYHYFDMFSSGGNLILSWSVWENECGGSSMMYTAIVNGWK